MSTNNNVEGLFKGFKNLNLYCRYWLPGGNPKAVLLVVHGLADHGNRYTNLVEYFVPRGYAVCVFDLRGHGKSEGVRGYTDRFSDYLTDLNIFTDKVRRDFKDVKIFLMGHSMGGTIATAYAVSHQDELAGLILSGPVLKPGASITSQQVFFARLLSVLLPKMGVAPLDATGVSRDSAVVKTYITDPLVYHGKISARLGAELINTMERELPAHIPEITLPLLIMYGSEDRLSNPAGCQLLYDAVKSTDKTLKRYDGLCHEIFNEPERQQVFADVGKWLLAHL